MTTCPRPSRVGETQLAFETFLEHRHWKPADPFFSKAVLWLHQAEHFYASGEIKRAYEIAARIDTPDVLAVMHAGRRFDGLIASDPEKFDVLKTAERRPRGHGQVSALAASAHDSREPPQ
jgi:hypothetical protein